MIWDIKKFNREIASLKKLKNYSALHPLAKAQVKERILASLNNNNAEPAPAKHARTFPAYVRIFRFAVYSLVLLGFVSGTAYAAGNSQPGSLLFPVKKAAHTVAVSLTASDEAKAELETKFAKKNLESLSATSTSTVHLSAAITSAPDEGTKFTETRHEIDEALSTLTAIKEKMKKKGNATAAAKIDRNIAEIKLRFEQELNGKKEKQNEDQNDASEQKDEAEIEIHRSLDSGSGTTTVIRKGNGNARIKVDQSKDGSSIRIDSTITATGTSANSTIRVETKTEGSTIKIEKRGNDD